MGHLVATDYRIENPGGKAQTSQRQMNALAATGPER